MPKCSRLGCNEEATRNSQVDIGFGMKADVWSCNKHHKDAVESSVDALEVDDNGKN